MDNAGTLIIEGDGTACNYDTMIVASTMSDFDVGTIIVRNGAKLSILNAWLKVGGDWTNEGTITCSTGSTVEFTDATRTSTISGANTFLNFVCTTPGKHIVFPSAKTTTVAAGGSLTLQSSGKKIVLGSDVPGTQWTFAVNSSATVNELVKLDVSDSKSSLRTLTAQKSSKSESQNNTNWLFPATQGLILTVH